MMKTTLINQFILSEEYHQQWWCQELHRKFIKEQYVRLPNLFTPEIFGILQSEVQRLEEFTISKDYRSMGTDTRRYMRVFGGVQILEKSPLLETLYVHHELRSLLSTIVNGPVYNSGHPKEMIGVHFLDDMGHTHGWHLDDNAFLFIITIEAPAREIGGTVEGIPDWRFHANRLNYKEDEPLESYVSQCREKNLVYEYYHAPGDAYLLRADEVLHRVKPLQQKDRRVVLVFGYNYSPKTIYSDRVTGLYDG